MTEHEEYPEWACRFDYDEWLESVEDKTITLDAPDGFPNVPACYYQPPWTSHKIKYCGECDGFRWMVSSGWYLEDPIGHCPVCGNEPGALELGQTVPPIEELTEV